MQIEQDEVEVRGGIRGGETLGSPIALWIVNRDHASWAQVMDPIANDPHKVELRRLHSPRPGHVDLAGGLKYDRTDLRDVLERASARETAARVAAGAIARMLLAELGVEIRSGVRSLGPIGADRPTPGWQELCGVDEESPLRAIDHALETEMVALVDRIKDEGDTLGGAVTVIAHGVPAGLGSHVQWDQKLDGRLAQAVMSVPAVKAVEIGGALAASRGPGSHAHDAIERHQGRWHRPTNHAGGLEGGITNGADVVVTAFMKPISTLAPGHAERRPRHDGAAALAVRAQRRDRAARLRRRRRSHGRPGPCRRRCSRSSAATRWTSCLAHWRATLELQERWPAVPGPSSP